jgi:hypothetical protein
MSEAKLDFVHFERAGKPDETSPFDLTTWIFSISGQTTDIEKPG